MIQILKYLGTLDEINTWLVKLCSRKLFHDGDETHPYALQRVLSLVERDSDRVPYIIIVEVAF